LRASTRVGIVDHTGAGIRRGRGWLEVDDEVAGLDAQRGIDVALDDERRARDAPLSQNRNVLEAGPQPGLASQPTSIALQATIAIRRQFAVTSTLASSWAQSSTGCARSRWAWRVDYG